MKRISLALAAAAMLAVPAGPVLADPPRHAPAWGYREKHERHERHERREAEYDRRGYYVHPRVIRGDDRIWRGSDGYYHCRRDNGTVGLIIGAAGGALVGRAIDTHGERLTGTLLGAALGGVIGQAIAKGDAYCR